MYELSLEKCERLLEGVDKVKGDIEQMFLQKDYVCECNEASKERRGELFARIRSGDMSAMDELLEYFGGCIDQWAKDIFEESVVEQVCYKAKLSAVLKSRASELTAENLNYELHMLAADVVGYQARHVIKWHEQQSKADEALSSAQSEELLRA